MTEFHITKKWREKSKVLRSIIHGTVLRNNRFRFKFNFKSFAADEHKVHNNRDHACIEDDKKLSSMSYKVGSLVRVPSRGLKKIGRAVSMRKHDQGKEEDGSLELCKKRIIMGKKCRPLNVSGALHYDKNGVLVPEDFLISPYNHSLL